MFEEAYVSGEQIVIVRVETGRLHGVWNLPVQVVCVHVCGCMRVCMHMPVCVGCVCICGVCAVFGGVCMCVYAFWGYIGWAALDEEIISSHHCFLETTESKLGRRG